MLSWDPTLASGHLAAADRRMAGVIERVGPCRMRAHAQCDPFPALLHAIVYQQLSGKAAASIHARLVGLFPQRAPEPAVLLGLEDEALRAAGMSRPKIAALRDLAAKALDGTLPPAQELSAMTDEEVMLALTRVRGIGPWSAQMYLMFRLGRPDVLPASDLGLLKGFRVGWNKRRIPTPDELLRHGRRWAPYRTAASWYLWALVDGDDAGW